MASPAEMSPLMTALINKGFVIKPRVAPTICMVFMMKRLLYIANLMVLSIEIITMIPNMITRASKTAIVQLAKVVIVLTVSSGYFTSLIMGPKLVFNNWSICWRLSF